MKNQMPLDAFGSKIVVEVRNPDGSVVSRQEFHNTYTYSFVRKVLRTLVQTTFGDKLTATDYAKKVAISEGVFPADPQDSDISDVVAYEALSALADITETAEKLTATRTVTWLNSTGSSVIVTYLALTYGDSTDKDQVFCLQELPSPDTVNDGQSLVINYSNEVTKDISYWSPI